MDGERIETTGLAGLTNTTLDDTPRRHCAVAQCGCMDRRILSPRRARFHAYLARVRGETADRVIASEPQWRLPRLTHQEA
jgi:hypothetical protein